MKIFILISIFCLSFPILAIDNVLLSKCYKCHKEDGKSWVDEIPTLTGQNIDYLRNQILNFRNGKRKDTYFGRMPEIVRQLSGDEIEQLIEHYSSQEPNDNYLSPGSMGSEEERLYAIGARYAPVCLGCHGLAEERPTGRSEWPYISGQNQAAILMQLRSFINNTRRAREMDFIKSAPFNDPKVLRALSIYFSRQLPPPVHEK